jgi:hypothetical protein
MNNPIALIRRGSACLLVSLLVTLLAGANPPAQAAPLSAPPTFTVNSPFDVVASPPLDSGPCETFPGNKTCTLRAAIEKANNFPGGGATIILPALPAGAEYALTIDELTIASNMTIIGGGAANTIIDGSAITPTNRVLFIGPAPIATISGVTVQGGRAIGGNSGGGIFVYFHSELTLRDSIVTSNTTTSYGGGILNDADALTVTDSIVSNNNSVTYGGGIYNYGGAVTLSGVTLSNNTSAQGGAVVNSSNHLFDIVDSTISGNWATQGGGIFNWGSSLAVVNSTISDNFSEGSGGGIFNYNQANCCTVSLYNATLAGNQANQAVVGGTGGGIFNSAGSTVQLQNTLLDDNTRSTNGQDVFDDCSGPATSLDYNLFSTTAGCTISGGTHDQKDKPGLTGPLQNNGGPTLTTALLPGSPAIDAGRPTNLAGCADPFGATLHTDQRGAPRPANGAGKTQCDIGAFELQRTVDLPLVRK